MQAGDQQVLVLGTDQAHCQKADVIKSDRLLIIFVETLHSRSIHLAKPQSRKAAKSAKEEWDS